MLTPSIKELRDLCQKTAPNPARESIVGKFSRRFSIYFTRALIPFSITPNQITVLSVLVFFTGIFCFFKGETIFNIIGSLIIFSSIILDGCDGEIARFKKNGSPAGTLYVEPVSHDIQYGFMFPLLGLALYLNGASFVYIIIGCIASFAKLEFRLLEMRFWTLSYGIVAGEEKISEIKQEYQKKPPLVRLVYWVNKNIFSSTGVFLMIFIASLIGRIDWYVVFYALGYALLYIALFVKQIYSISKKQYASSKPNE